MRADAETEKYTVAIQSYYRTHENHQDRGLSFEGFCDIYCFQLLTITPTDMRYNGAQITGVVNIPESVTIHQMLLILLRSECKVNKGTVYPFS